MNRFEFHDKYRLFIPLTHLRQFEADLYTVIHHEVWMERFLQQEREGEVEQRQ